MDILVAYRYQILKKKKRWGRFLPRVPVILEAATLVGLGRARLGPQKCLTVDTILYTVDRRHQDQSRERERERDGGVELK